MPPLNPTKAQINPKKKFGQNFLVNQPIRERVVTFMRQIVTDYSDLNILEIGPGQGDLTHYLAGFERSVVALEIDPEAMVFLTDKFKNEPNLKIIQADGLRAMEAQIQSSNSKIQSFQNQSRPSPVILGTKNQSGDESFSISQAFKHSILLANLPFNVGSRILVDLPVLAPNAPFCVILQKEVAQKTLKNKDFTLFGAWLNLFYECKILMDLPPQAFYPQPRVVSALLVGRPKLLQNSKFKTQNLENFQYRREALVVLKKLFANPRKTLASNLRNLGWSKERVDNFIRSHNLEPETRLNWNNYDIILELIQKSD
jgi:16S rRNA (adenine1518-N6/adenine1519-N6)-dimethyltransferase